MDYKRKLLIFGVLFFIILSISVVSAKDNSLNIESNEFDDSSYCINENVGEKLQNEQLILSSSDNDLIGANKYPYTTKTVTLIIYDTHDLRSYERENEIWGYVDLKEVVHKDQYNSKTTNYCVNGVNITYKVVNSDSKLVYYSSLITEKQGSFSFISNKELIKDLPAGYYKAIITANSSIYKNIKSLSWTIDASNKAIINTADGVTYTKYPQYTSINIKVKYKGVYLNFDLQESTVNKIKSGKFVEIGTKNYKEVPIVKWVTKYTTKYKKTKLWAWKYFKKSKKMQWNKKYISKTFKNAMKKGKYLKTTTKNRKYGKICYQTWKIPTKVKKQTKKIVYTNKEIHANFFKSNGGQYPKGYWMSIGYDGASIEGWQDYKININYI